MGACRMLMNDSTKRYTLDPSKNNIDIRASVTHNPPISLFNMFSVIPGPLLETKNGTDTQARTVARNRTPKTPKLETIHMICSTRLGKSQVQTIR